jgi:hypothetical protein
MSNQADPKIQSMAKVIAAELLKQFSAENWVDDMCGEVYFSLIENLREEFTVHCFSGGDVAVWGPDSIDFANTSIQELTDEVIEHAEFDFNNNNGEDAIAALTRFDGILSECLDKVRAKLQSTKS